MTTLAKRENNHNRTEDRPVLEVRDLSISFEQYDRGWNKEKLKVIHCLDATVGRGEILAVVGSSGSGKSLLAHEILGILPGNAQVTGSIKFMGEPLTAGKKKELRGKEIALIPQSVEYLDPLMKVGKQVMGTRGDEGKMRQVFQSLGLPEETAHKYPFQLSGGMARRVLIATALMEDPSLIVADEPTPGLELDRAMETLQFFRKIADGGAGVLLITHDVDLALHVADRIAVFYAGTTVEICPVDDFVSGGNRLRHPYSRAFLEALPQKSFSPIPGSQPYASRLPKGCIFGDRCPLKTPECEEDIPMKRMGDGEVRCIHAT